MINKISVLLFVITFFVFSKSGFSKEAPPSLWKMITLSKEISFADLIQKDTIDEHFVLQHLKLHNFLKGKPFGQTKIKSNFMRKCPPDIVLYKQYEYIIFHDSSYHRKILPIINKTNKKLFTTIIKELIVINEIQDKNKRAYETVEWMIRCLKNNLTKNYVHTDLDKIKQKLYYSDLEKQVFGEYNLTKSQIERITKYLPYFKDL